MHTILPVLAHPLTEPGGLGVPPVFSAAVIVTIALLIAHRWPAVTADREQGDLRQGGPVWRAAGVLLLVLVVVAGRLGRDSQINNIAPSLAIGVIWPLLLGLSLAGVQIWQRVNPLETLSMGLERLASPADGEVSAADRQLPGGRMWALPSAVLWTYYLGVFPNTLEPRVVGSAVAGYVMIHLGIGLVVGRQRWLANGEVFTVLFNAMAHGHAARPASRSAAASAALMGALAGGLAFGTLRISELWLRQLTDLGWDPTAQPATVPGLLVISGLSAWGAVVAERASVRSGAPAGVIGPALALVVAGIGLAQGMVRERLLKAAILVIARLSNPLGGDNDLLGTARLLPANEVIGESGRVAVQLTVLLVAAILAAIAGRRMAGARARPVLVAVSVFTGLGVISVTAV